MSNRREVQDDLTLSDNGQGGSYNGLIGNGAVVKGSGKLTLTGTAAYENGLGYGGSSITVGALDINIVNNDKVYGAAAVYADNLGGSHIIEAETVKLVNQNQTAVALQSSSKTGQKIEISGFTQLDIEGGWDGHGLRQMHDVDGSIVLTGKEGVESTVNISSAKTSDQTGRSALYLASAEANNTASVKIKATNVNIESKTTVNDSENGFKKGAVIAMTKNAHQLTVEADSLKVSNLNRGADNATYAIGIAHGTADLTGNQSVEIDGQVSVLSGGSLTLTGGSVSVTSDTRGIVADGGSVIVNGATNITAVAKQFSRGVTATNGGTVSINSGEGRAVISAESDQKTDGSQVTIGIFALKGSTVNVEGDELIVSAKANETEWAYGIHAQNSSTTASETDKVATININSGKTVVNVAGQGQALSAMSQGRLNINGDLYVNTDLGDNAARAIVARGHAVVNINESGTKTVQMKGDISFDYDAKTSGTTVDADVSIKLMKKDSYWTGATQIEGNPPEGKDEVTHPGFQLTIANGAMWNVTGDSFVTTLALENGGVVNASDYSVEMIDIDTFNVSGADASTVVGGAATAFNVNKLSVAEGGSLIVDGNLNLKSGENKGTVTFVGGEFTGDMNVGATETSVGSVVIDGNVTNKGQITADTFTLKNGTFTAMKGSHDHANTSYWLGGSYVDADDSESNTDADALICNVGTDYLAGTKFYAKDALIQKLVVTSSYNASEPGHGNVIVLADYSEQLSSVTVSEEGVLQLGRSDTDPAVVGRLDLETFAQDGGTMTVNAGSSLKVTGEMNVTGGKFSNAGIIDVTEAAKLALNGVVLEQGGTLEAKSGQFFSTALDAEGKVEQAGKVDLLGLTAAGGSLALIDAKYNLAYVQSANELLSDAKFGGKLVMRGTLVESESDVKDMTIDQIGSVGDNTVLSQVTGSTEDKNLVIGSDSTNDKTASTSNSFGVANLDLGTGSSVKVGGEKTLTLVGNGGELVNSKAQSTTITLDGGNLEIGGTDNGTTGGTLKSDVNVGANSNMTISGEAEFNLSSNVNLTSSTSTASIKDNASVTISKTNITEGTMDIEAATANIGEADVTAGKMNLRSQAKANVESLKLGSGAVLNVNEKADATVGKLEGAGTINVGNKDSAGKLTINDASNHTGVIFVDPAWSDDASLDVIENASSLEIYTRDATSPIASKIIVGTNSIVALGGSADEAVAAFNAIKDAQGVSWRDVGAALYVGSPVTVTGGILVKEGSRPAEAEEMAERKIVLANHSMLIVNTEAGRDGAAITGDVKFSDGSVLGLTNVDAGEFTLASGDVFVGNDVTVKTDNPFISADLSDSGTITANVSADNGLGALGSTGIQAMARRADFVLAQTIADRTAVDQELGTGLNLWADVTGERYEADSLANGGNFRADAGYGAFGADFAVTQDIALGGAIQYGKASVRSGVSNIKNDIDSYGITAYGSMNFGDAKIVGELAYVKSENDITSSQAALNGKVDADIYSLGVTAQYKLTAGSFSFVPSIGMRVSRLETDAMQIGAVTVDKQKQTLVQVPVALRINGSEMNVAGWNLAPSFKIGYVPTFGDKEIKVLGVEQDVIDTSPVQGEFGLRAVNGSLMLNANLMVGGGKDGTSAVGGKIGVKYLF